MRNPTLSRRILIGGGLTALAGCAARPAPTRAFADITFRQFPPIRMRASGMEIVRQYRPPEAPPHIEHHMPVSPATVAARWATDRLEAAGGAWRLRYVIRQASVIETALPRTTGMQAMFRIEQSERYDGKLEVALEVIDAQGRRDGEVSAVIERGETIAENATIAERERLWFQMVEMMGRDLNAELDRNIRTILARFVIS